MSDVRPMLAEAVRALAALALFLLALSNAPLAVAGGDGYWTVYDASSFCGTAPVERQGHARCEACRIAGGVTLPPPCAVVDRARLEAGETTYGAVPAGIITGLPRLRPETRAPPLA